MSLELLMPNTHAKPGFNRAGMVILRAPSEKTIAAKAYFVRLLGICTTRILVSEGHLEKIEESRAVFLEIRKDLQPTPTVVEDGMRSQFQIRFPEYPAAKRRLPDLGDLNWILEIPEPQSLPPSGIFGPGNTIAYKFEIVLQEEDSDRQIKAEQDCTFSVTRQIQSSDLKMIKTVQKLPNDGAGLDGSQRLNLALECAFEIVQVEPLSLWLSIGDKDECSSAKILLKSSTLQLIEKTAIQGDNDLESKRTDTHIIESRIFESNFPIITTQATNLGTLLHYPSISSDHLPTLSCTNIQRTYGMSISLVVEVEDCDDTHEIQFNLDSVTLFPAEHSDVAWQKEIEEEAANDPFDTPAQMRRFAGR